MGEEFLEEAANLIADDYRPNLDWLLDDFSKVPCTSLAILKGIVILPLSSNVG